MHQSSFPYWASSFHCNLYVNFLGAYDVSEDAIQADVTEESVLPPKNLITSSVRQSCSPKAALQDIIPERMRHYFFPTWQIIAGDKEVYNFPII
jgi:hypothetical protein